MSEDNDTFKLDGDTVSLADLAGISLDSIAEKRGGESFPKGVFAWEVDTESAPHLVVFGEGDKAKGGATFKLKCIDVLAVTDEDFTADKNSLIGKYHTENFFLSGKIEDALGYIKGFVKDMGAPYNSDLKTLLAGSAGTRFQAPIMKRKNKDDTDVVYTNINRLKMKPMAAAATSSLQV